LPAAGFIFKVSLGLRVERVTSPIEQKSRSRVPQAEAELVSGPKPRQRMAPRDRERFILENAMRFFAERGLGGETRELARRLGITQPLIYRYFPSKDALIERVYEKWFREYWDPSWEQMIADRRYPLEERLQRFYADYIRIVFNYEWVRLFAFSGLAGLPHHRRFVQRNRDDLYCWIARELRHDHRLPPLEDVPLTQFEGELLWGLHATVFYVGQRRWLFGLPVVDDVNTIMAARVRGFLAGAPQQIVAHFAQRDALKHAGD
jgi:AcrR family transcriptional regulator